MAKHEPTFDELLAIIREEHTANLTRAIIATDPFCCHVDEMAMEANRIAKHAIQQATAAVATAYVREYERKDAAKAQAKQDRNMKLFNRTLGRWGQE